jgi:hypothetical protein
VDRAAEAADPVLIDVAPAGEVIPGLKDKMILHAGPPVDWLHMSGAQKGAVIGIVLFEGWDKNRDEVPHQTVSLRAVAVPPRRPWGGG